MNPESFRPGSARPAWGRAGRIGGWTMGETLLFPSLESLIPYAFGLAWKLARSKEEAEDLAQESLLKAWEKRTQLRDAVSVKPWLRSILVTTHLQRLRASEKPDWRRAVEEGGDEVEHIPDPVPEIAALVAADEAVLAMRNGCFLAMGRKLTLEQRTVFSLSCMFGLGIKEIAGYLQTSPGAIKALLYRAKTNLAAFFNTHCAWIEDTYHWHRDKRPYLVKNSSDKEQGRSLVTLAFFVPKDSSLSATVAKSTVELSQ